MAGRRGGRLRAGPHCSHRHRLRQLHPCGQPRRGRADDGRWSGRPGRGDRSGGPGDRGLAQPSGWRSADRHADDLPRRRTRTDSKALRQVPGLPARRRYRHRWCLDRGLAVGFDYRHLESRRNRGPDGFQPPGSSGRWSNSAGATGRLTYNPAVAISPEGDSVVVWLCDLPRDGENRQLIVSRVISADGTVGQLRVLGEDDAFPGTCGCPQVPQVATDADGDSIAALAGRRRARTSPSHLPHRSPRADPHPTPGRSNEGADHLEHGLPEVANERRRHRNRRLLGRRRTRRKRAPSRRRRPRPARPKPSPASGFANFP